MKLNSEEKIDSGRPPSLIQHEQTQLMANPFLTKIYRVLPASMSINTSTLYCASTLHSVHSSTVLEVKVKCHPSTEQKRYGTGQERP